MNPTTDEFVRQIDAIRKDAIDLTRDLTEQQMNWKPDPAKWSVAQNLDHLTRTVMMYLDEIPKMTGEARAREKDGKGAYREGFIARYIVNTMEPPPKVRAGTRKFAEPRPDLKKETVLREFDDIHSRLADAVTGTDGVALGHARMRSPFAPILKFTLGQAIKLNLAHGRRHLYQARQVLKAYHEKGTS